PAAAGNSPTTAWKAALGEQVLAPFADRLRRARRVRLLPYGALAEVDLHDLPFEGRPLIAGRPVVYGLDLAAPALPAAARPAAGSGPLRATVVADPRGDLPHARSEAKSVAAALRDGCTVDPLEGEHATLSALLLALGGSDLLHYA